MMAPMSEVSSSGSSILKRLRVLGELAEERVEDIGVQEEARAKTRPPCLTGRSGRLGRVRATAPLALMQREMEHVSAGTIEERVR
jgi:hypothetical protein